VTVVDITRDTQARTLTITAEYPAPAEQVWQLWADPRLLERWWGPPSFPATVVDHDLRPGGRVTYFMTGPEGERFHGYWVVGDVEPPSSLTFEDGFADDTFAPNPDLPVSSTSVGIETVGSATRMTIRTSFPSQEAMNQLLEMGMEEGMAQALGQTDALLAGAATR
jgi:uncharacterized protein YndB with AHSA1/START domain